MPEEVETNSRPAESVQAAPSQHGSQHETLILMPVDASTHDFAQTSSALRDGAAADRRPFTSLLPAGRSAVAVEILGQREPIDAGDLEPTSIGDTTEDTEDTNNTVLGLRAPGGHFGGEVAPQLAVAAVPDEIIAR